MVRSGSDSSDTSDDDADEWDEYEQTIIGDEEDDAGGSADVGKMDALEQRMDSMERLLQTIAQQVSEIHANHA